MYLVVGEYEGSHAWWGFDSEADADKVAEDVNGIIVKVNGQSGWELFWKYMHQALDTSTNCPQAGLYDPNL